MTNNGFRAKQIKNTTTKQKSKHKNPCQSRETNMGRQAPKFDALPLDHRNI